MPTLEQTLAETLDASFKGFPAERAPFRVADAGSRDLRLLRGDLPFPVALLRESAMRHNADWIGRYVRETGVSLAPHGKTTMAPQIFDEQLRGGAWGITVANVHQGGIAAQAGVPRVLMANELASVGDARRWLALAEQFAPSTFLSLVDSTDQLALLERAARDAGATARFDLLVELGAKGGRTGCRDADAALALARAVRESPHARLAGVEAYEGVVTNGDSDHDRPLVAAWMQTLATLARACDAHGLFEGDEVVVSAGGSAVFDLVTDALAGVALSRPARVVLRSGCYITHDHGTYVRAMKSVAARGLSSTARSGPMRGALEVWGAVQSRPEPELAIVTMGKRDVSFDVDLPVPILWFRPGEHTVPQPAPAHWRITRLMDQHAFLPLRADDGLRVGDWLAVGISHPCTTFDKWRLIWAVDDDYRVTRAIRTYF